MRFCPGLAHPVESGNIDRGGACAPRKIVDEQFPGRDYLERAGINVTHRLAVEQHHPGSAPVLARAVASLSGEHMTMLDYDQGRAIVADAAMAGQLFNHVSVSPWRRDAFDPQQPVMTFAIGPAD